MSYILDALKKSEHERQQNQAPTVHSIYAGVRPSGGQSQTSWLLIALLVLIISGLAVSGFWWYSTNQHSLAPASSSDAAITKAGAENKADSIAPDTKTVLEKKIDTESKASVENKVAELKKVENSKGLVTVEPIVDEGEQELLPVMQLAELPDTVRSSLPSMSYSFHVYSSDKNKCTIIINNRRYREGEVIGSGWLLDSITETGIVVRKQRYRAAIQVVDTW